jgi:hypothetical protein
MYGRFGAMFMPTDYWLNCLCLLLSKDNGAISYETITRDSLIAFYTEHNPDNLGNVDHILQGYSLRDIKDSSRKRYGNSPDVAVIAKAKGVISTVIVNKFPLSIQDIKSAAELDFSGKNLEFEDAIIIAALIPSNVSRAPCHRFYYH